MKTWIVAIIVAIVVFELAEHLIFPLVWSFLVRRRRSTTGPAGMVGETVVVKTWADTSGQVRFKGELWNAVSPVPLAPGQTAIIEKVDGLTLRVKPTE